MEGVGKLGKVHAQFAERAVVDELGRCENLRLLARALLSVAIASA